MVFRGGAGIGNVNWIRFRNTAAREAVNLPIGMEEKGRLSMTLYPNPNRGEKIKLNVKNANHGLSTTIVIHEDAGTTSLFLVKGNSIADAQDVGITSRRWH